MSNKNKLTKPFNKKSYTQTSKINIENIICIKDSFPTLSSRKIKEINNIIHKSNMVKPKIRMTTKGPLHKQVIILMNKSNRKVIMKQANFHINNINRHLKDANSKNFANFVCLENHEVIITTNQTVSAQNMSIIDNCVREIENINSKHIDIP